MKKKFFASLLVGATILGCGASVQAEENRSQILKVYNWADYIDENLISEFETWYKEQTGEPVKVIYETFDINENMLTEIEVGHEDYDVVCPSEYIIERMLRSKLLLPINQDFGSTPNYLNYVSPFATDKFEQMGDGSFKVSDYTVGYMWGTTGIMYNTAYVKADEVDSWSALLNPKFEQHIFMKDAYRDVYSTLICYARYDDILAGKVTRDDLVAHITDENIAAVEKVLTEAKPNISGWEVDFGKEMMTKGKGWININWSGDAQWSIEEAAENGVSLDYIVPKEGSNVWFDGWVIPIYAKNPKAASYWINFMCNPENAIRNMNEIGYVSVIATPEIMEAMSDSTIQEFSDLSYFFGDSIGADSMHISGIMYPDRSVIERCALMHDCADKTEAMLEMWSRVKGDNLNTGMVSIVVGVIVIILILVAVNRSKKKKKYSRRR